MKSIIEETGVDAIDTQEDGIVRPDYDPICDHVFSFNNFTLNLTFFWLLQVKITARDLASIEKSKAIITNLTMVPTIGDIYR